MTTQLEQDVALAESLKINRLSILALNYPEVVHAFANAIRKQVVLEVLNLTQWGKVESKEKYIDVSSIQELIWQQLNPPTTREGEG